MLAVLTRSRILVRHDDIRRMTTAELYAALEACDRAIEAAALPVPKSVTLSATAITGNGERKPGSTFP